jgi:hypothetical protein
MPVTALLITGGVAVGTSVAKGIQSAVRARRARKEAERLEKNLVNPSYEMPQELMSAYNRQMSTPIQDMQGLQNARYASDVGYGQSLAGISGGAASSQDFLSAATTLGEQKMLGDLQTTANFQMQNSQFRQQQEYEKTRGINALAFQLAGQRENMHEQNELNPFLRTSAAISALREKRYQESNNTLDSFANAAVAGGNMFAQGMNPTAV